MIYACKSRPVGRNMHTSKMVPPSAGSCLHGAAHVKGYLLSLSFCFSYSLFFGPMCGCSWSCAFFLQTVFKVFSLGRHKQSVISFCLYLLSLLAYCIIHGLIVRIGLQ